MRQTARRFVLSQVTQVLAAQQIELRADELSYNLFDLSATLVNVRVRRHVGQRVSSVDADSAVNLKARAMKVIGLPNDIAALEATPRG